MFHPTYISKTNWRKHFNADVPTDYASFMAMLPLNAPPCTFKTGFVFKWSAKSTLLGGHLAILDRDVIAHNSVQFEGLMWKLYDLSVMLGHIVHGKEQNTLTDCILMSEKVLTLIKDINEYDFKPRDDNKLALSINLARQWKGLLPGQIKMEWYLLSSKNISLVKYTQSEIASFKFRILLKGKDKGFLHCTHHLIEAAKLMRMAVDLAENYDAVYKAHVTTSSLCKDIDAFTWLYKYYNFLLGSIEPGSGANPYSFLNRGVCLVLLLHIQTLCNEATDAVKKMLTEPKLVKIRSILEKDLSDRGFYTCPKTAAAIFDEFTNHCPLP